MEKINRINNYLVNSEYMSSINTESIIEKWTNLGFMYGLTTSKRNVALAFEFACIYQLDDVNKDKKYEQTSVFPVIRNIFSKIDADILMTDIMTNVVEITIDFSLKYFKAEPSFYSEDGKLIVLPFDHEAIFCKNYADNYKLKL